MENKFNDPAYIAWKWCDFTIDIIDDKKFDAEAFLELFNESFAVLREYTCESSVCREMMELVKSIGVFLGTRFTPVDHEHSAACELADAMLTHCLCGSKKDTSASKGVWSFIRDEIEVDFENAEEELFRWTLTIEELSDLGIW